MSQAGSLPENALFLRKWSLVVANSGEALDLSEMHFTVNTTQSDVETPNSAIIRIYNLKRETVNRLVSNEFDRVVFSAGYQQGPYGVAFDGQIKQSRQGKENQTDTYLDILAADGDEAYNYGVVNQTLAAGATVGDQVNAIAGAMGVDVGYVSDSLLVGNPQLSIRGKALYGLGKTYMRKIALSNNARWSIQNGKMVLLANSDYIQADPIVLSPATGLIGIPEQTQSGISFQALFNPKLIIGQPVKIDSTLINTAQFNVAYGDLSQNPINVFPPLSAAGLYRIVVSEFSGDTRGDDWYSNMIAFAINPDVASAEAVNPWPGSQSSGS